MNTNKRYMINIYIYYYIVSFLYIVYTVNSFVRYKYAAYMYK